MSNGRFPESFVDRVLSSTDVAAIIGRYTSLKRRGKRLVGLCPFHKEKTPSFTVDPEQGLYYCFGCGVGGNIFTFLKEKEGLSFYQAVEMLAREAGLEIPRLEGNAKDTEGLAEAAEFGTTFFQKALDADIGKDARAYLANRGISQDIWEKFRIGWAPADQMHLPKSVKKANRNPEPFIKIGLLGRSKGGDKLFAPIADALVFPIPRPGGKIAGFAHRRIREDESYTGPKYINSADNELYNKSYVLYGLPQARSSIRSEGKTILVEGYFDVLALAQSGIENVVASCGTALTSYQATLLARYAKKTIVLFDGDEAGMRATLRSLELLLAGGHEVFVVRLPEDEDPDSFINKEGAEKLLKLVDSAPVWFDWLYDEALGKTDSSVAGAITVIDEMARPLGAVADEMSRNMYIRDLAKRLGTSEEELRDRLRKAYRRERKEELPKRETKEDLPDQAKLELALIATVLRCGETYCDENPLTLYPGLWEKVIAGAKAVELLNEIADDRAKSCLSELLLEPDPANFKTHQNALLKKIKRAAISERIERLRANLRNIEKDDKDSEKQILSEMSELSQELSRLSRYELKITNKAGTK